MSGRLYGNLLIFVRVTEFIPQANISLKLGDFAALFHQVDEHREYACQRAGCKKNQQQYHQIGFPLQPEEILQLDRLVILDRQSEQQDEQSCTQKPIEKAHDTPRKKADTTIA